jgi:cytochrome P450
LRKAFRVDDLTREVHDEVSQMSAILQSVAARAEEKARDREEQRLADREAAQRRIERIIFFVTFVILPMQTLLALFGSKLASWPGLRTLSAPWSEAISIIVIALLLSFPVTWAIQQRRRRRREAHGQGPGSRAERR